MFIFVMQFYEQKQIVNSVFWCLILLSCVLYVRQCVLYYCLDKMTLVQRIKFTAFYKPTRLSSHSEKIVIRS